MYLNTPTSRNGTSSACSIFSSTTSVAVVANAEPTMRIDIIVPANNKVFFAPMRLMIHGEQNIMMALHNSPAVVTKPNISVPCCGEAKKVLKKVANCRSNTSYTQATPTTYKISIHNLRSFNNNAAVFSETCG